MKASESNRRQIDVLTTDEVRRLLGCCSSKSSTGLRNCAVIVVLWRGMLRISEALSLRPSDIHDDTLRVQRGKGDKFRTVCLDLDAQAVLGRWIERRASLGINGHAPLFCTLKGARLARQYVTKLLPRLAKQAQLEKRVHAHGLRHSGAYDLAMSGVPMPLIKAQLGHRNIATTSRYLDHVAPADLVSALRGRRWNSAAQPTTTPLLPS